MKKNNKENFFSLPTKQPATPLEEDECNAKVRKLIIRNKCIKWCAQFLLSASNTLKIWPKFICNFKLARESIRFGAFNAAAAARDSFAMKCKINSIKVLS